MKIKKILTACMALIITGGAMTAAPQLVPDYSITASAELDDDGSEYTEGAYESLTYRKYSDHIVITGCDDDFEGELIIPSEIEGLPVTVIGDDAFFLCDDITSVTIPDSVTTIEKWAFACCEKLGSVAIPDSVTSIGMCAFYDCVSLSSVVMPESLTTIEAGVFAWCEGLVSITISESVTSIGEGSFSNCSSISSITIPNSVNNIEYGAFAGCESLDSITILDPACYIYDDAATICGKYDYEENDDDYELRNASYDGTICGYEGSSAQAYAEKYGRKFESLGEAPEKFGSMLGDTNGDGVVDAADASDILAMYARSSTTDVTPTEEELKIYDVSKDGGIDASDASTVLAYYAFTSTGGEEMSLEEYIGLRK